MAAFRSAGTTFKDDKEVMELLMLCAQLEERAVAKSSDPHGTAKLEGLMARAQEEMMRIQHDPSLSPEAKQAKVMEVLQKVQLESMKAMPSMPTPQQMMGAPVAGVPGAVPFAPLGMPPMMPGMPPMMPGMMPGMPPMMPGMPGMPGMPMPPGMDGSPFNAPGQMRMKDE
uniref:Uncharacterized protein n=2 Tax=Palpitomonas bilix TaxID=652834 RepID=A0A7S3DCI0_9EUKA|mmetsp:Transcript_31011/g.81427  ORF Transcript_31011/g.81427 Transcript_31011/m.81427 type:complete len:170 (+) Transcript_31011:270-779(+)